MREPKKVPGVENRRRTRRDGTVYWTFRIRWIDPVTRERVGEEFDTQRDAIDYQARLRLARRGGALADLAAGRETLADYAEHWWKTYAAHNLARPTLTGYSDLWNRIALPRLGHLQLRAVTPGVVTAFRGDLEQAGMGAPTIRKTLAMLQSMLRRAVEEDRLPSNPVAAVRKPAARRARVVQPLPPTVVETVRSQLEQRDAALISVLAYSGLRPEEALALEWRHVRKTTVLVEQKNVDGSILVGAKVQGFPARTVDLLSALRGDLAAHKLASGRPVDHSLVFPRPDGRPFRETDYRNWRTRVFQPAAAAAGIATITTTTATALVNGERVEKVSRSYDGPRPYDLRHSFASLLIHEGQMSVVEIAAQMGHSTETLLRTYAHVFAELRGQPKVPADVQIAKARGAAQEKHG